MGSVFAQILLRVREAAGPSTTSAHASLCSTEKNREQRCATSSLIPVPDTVLWCRGCLSSAQVRERERERAIHSRFVSAAAALLSLASSFPSCVCLKIRHQIKYLTGIYLLSPAAGILRGSCSRKDRWDTMKLCCVVVLFVGVCLSESVHANYRVCVASCSLLILRQSCINRLTAHNVPHLYLSSLSLVRQFKRQLGGYRFPGPRLSEDYTSASQSRALVKRQPQVSRVASRDREPRRHQPFQSRANSVAHSIVSLSLRSTKTSTRARNRSSAQRSRPPTKPT